MAILVYMLLMYLIVYRTASSIGKCVPLLGDFIFRFSWLIGTALIVEGFWTMLHWEGKKPPVFLLFAGFMMLLLPREKRFTRDAEQK